MQISNVCAINRKHNLYDHCKNPSKHHGKLKNICPDDSFKSSLKICKWTLSLIQHQLNNESMFFNKHRVQQPQNIENIAQLSVLVYLIIKGRIILEFSWIMFYFWEYYSIAAIQNTHYHDFHYHIETKYIEVQIQVFKGGRGFFYCRCLGVSKLKKLQILTPPVPSQPQLYRCILYKVSRFCNQQI